MDIKSCTYGSGDSLYCGKSMLPERRNKSSKEEAQNRNCRENSWENAQNKLDNYRGLSQFELLRISIKQKPSDLNGYNGEILQHTLAK